MDGSRLKLIVIGIWCGSGGQAHQPDFNTSNQLYESTDLD